MKFRSVFLLLFFIFGFFISYAQSQDNSDAQIAQRYVNWARQAVDEERWDDALASLERGADFAGVSSDISYLLALVRSHKGKNRNSVIEAADAALETNRWVNYKPSQALLLKAGQLIAMRRFVSALDVIDQAGDSADAVMLRLMAFRGLAANPHRTEYFDPVQALARFRSLLLSAMDRYPRDPRPLKIFFEYAHNRSKGPVEFPSGDIDLLELALLRLPFLLETDSSLAWMASPFMRNTEDARRLVASYIVQQTGPLPAASIPAVLNFGLTGDIEASEDFFSHPSLEKNLIDDVYNLLRSDEGRDFFTQKLLSFSGFIFSDDDRDGIEDGAAFYNSGVIEEFAYDRNQSNDFDLRIFFDADGVPVRAAYPVTGQAQQAQIRWERYPSVEKITLSDETFQFRPADFQFAPITFNKLGGGKSISGGKSVAGLDFPVMSYQNMDITRRALVSFCSSISRPSVEFKGAVEQIFLERGIPLQAVEALTSGMQVSVTEFERGMPVIQHIDLDLDGRMETIRRFYRPDNDFLQTFNYRAVIASSESDWTGDGKYKTGEVYLNDGSVVYSWDMDGSGAMNYSEKSTGNE